MGRSPGKQPGDPGFTLRQVANPDKVIVYRPHACDGCGRSLRRAPVSSTGARQVFDLPPVVLRVTESRASRNLTALMDLYRQAMSDEYRELRGRLIHTDEFDSLVATPYGPKHVEIHRLLGLYEMLGAFTRNKLIDDRLVFRLFPRSIVTCYDKTLPYIECYRLKANHPSFGHNFACLVERIRQQPSPAPADA